VRRVLGRRVRGLGGRVGQVADDHAAAVGADVDAAVDLGVAGDGRAGPRPLVLVVVDARPGLPGVVGAEDAAYPVDLRRGVDRRVAPAGSGLAEADHVALVHLAETGEGGPGVGGAPQAVGAVGLAARQPDVALVAGHRREADVALRGQAGGRGLGERRAAVGAGVERA